MRGILALVGAAIAACLIAMLVLRPQSADGAFRQRPDDTTTNTAGTADLSDAPGAEPAEPKKDREDATDGKGKPGRERPAVLRAPGWKEIISQSSATFPHLVSGEPVPLDVRESAGLNARDAVTVEQELRAELEDIQRSLREFIGTLKDFRHSAEEVAAASALDLMTWVAQYQPMSMEMASVTQLFDENQQRRFVQERRPWTEFFKEGGLVMRFARVMHGVRVRTIARIEQAGVNATAFDGLRQRRLLDGHFRPGKDLPFDFGRALGPK